MTMAGAHITRNLSRRHHGLSAEHNSDRPALLVRLQPLWQRRNSEMARFPFALVQVLASATG